MTGRRTDPCSTQHPSGALLLLGAEAELGAPKGWFSGESWETETARNMVGSSAVGVLSTHIGQAADVHTFVADARPLASTVGVADAL